MNQRLDLPNVMLIKGVWNCYVFHLMGNIWEFFWQNRIECWVEFYHLSHCVYREASSTSCCVFGQVHYQHATCSLAPSTSSWVLPASVAVRCSTSSLTNTDLWIANYPNHTHQSHGRGGASTGTCSKTYVFSTLEIGNVLYMCLDSETNCRVFPPESEESHGGGDGNQESSTLQVRAPLHYSKPHAAFQQERKCLPNPITRV